MRRALPFAVLYVSFSALAASPPAGRAPDRLIVKFVEGAQVRLRGGGLVSETGRDLSAVLAALDRHGRPAVEPLFRRGPAAIDATRAEAEARTGTRMPDLNGYFEIAVRAADRDALRADLARLTLVEKVYAPSLPAPPPGDIPPPTPDFESQLLYLDPAPTGVDAEWAWAQAGGTGAGVVVTDIEYSWRTTHEDLDAAVGASRCYDFGTDQIEHGTAVAGLVAAGRNGYGTTGIAHGVSLRLVSDYPVGMSYSVARAIDCASGFMSAGDVMLLEAQTYGPTGQNDFVPVEYDDAEYDSIVVATGKGVHVVEAAGNGGVNLDDPALGGKFNPAVRDSKAIIVGAGAPFYEGYDLAREPFSSYGQRVNVQCWGDDVGTTGSGDYWDGGGDPNQYYTSGFSGTSSASAMCAGVVADVCGVQKACGGAPLSPTALRGLLVDTGTPQTDGPYPGHIGPRPDLRAALERVNVDNDGDGFAECQGDCDDTRASVRPGAVEINDGIDNQCPGTAGYGVVDETSGDSGFHNPANKNEYSWTAQSGATSYQVARSDRPDFASGCAKTTTSATSWADAAVPPVGKAYFYLNRPLTPFAGSWGESAAVPRAGVCP